MNLTLVSCWYSMKSKFDKSVYQKWMMNFLTQVNNFNLVIFTDNESISVLPMETINKNPKIKIIIQPFHSFFTWKHKEDWVKNHIYNNLLNHNSRWNTDWKLNMLWNEKINFVNEVITNKYFDSQWYGWCDIGYFRGNETRVNEWPNVSRIQSLNVKKIYYGLPGSRRDLNNLLKIILNKNENNLPVSPIPPQQVSIAGGFFLIHCENISLWHEMFYKRLNDYFHHNYLVKDDQIIIIDCIMNNLKYFELIEEKNPTKDRWFVFQNYLV
jgi:hypothetical protein